VQSYKKKVTQQKNRRKFSFTTAFFYIHKSDYSKTARVFSKRAPFFQKRALIFSKRAPS